MRGEDQRSEVLFSYVRLGAASQPIIRCVRSRTLIDEALNGLSRDFNKALRARRTAVDPAGAAVAALLLQAFYTVRSERQLMEQLNYNLLFRWFVGLSADDQVWNATSSARTGIGLLDGDIAAKFLCQRVEPASSPQAALRRALLGRWHPDRGLGQHEELCAEGRRAIRHREKVMVAVGANAERQLPRREAQDDTHFSTTDPDARLFRKGAGKEAKLCHIGHLMMENRNGLIVDARLTEANGTASARPRST